MENEQWTKSFCIFHFQFFISDGVGWQRTAGPGDTMRPGVRRESSPLLLAKPGRRVDINWSQ
jgi:hypothetical protein